MKLSTLYFTSLAFLPSFTFATAIPDVASRNETLAKRGGEVNYLANCLHYQTTWIPGDSYHVSHMAWYSNSDNSLNGQQPDSLSNEYRDWSRNGDYLIWEGSQQNLYFADSGVTVQTHIDADAQSRAFTDWAGWAQRTSDWKTYNCYKDNGRQLFVKTLPFPQSLVCNAIYWCV